MEYWRITLSHALKNFFFPFLVLECVWPLTTYVYFVLVFLFFQFLFSHIWNDMHNYVCLMLTWRMACIWSILEIFPLNLWERWKNNNTKIHLTASRREQLDNQRTKQNARHNGNKCQKTKIRSSIFVWHNCNLQQNKKWIINKWLLRYHRTIWCEIEEKQANNKQNARSMIPSLSLYLSLPLCLSVAVDGAQHQTMNT